MQTAATMYSFEQHTNRIYSVGFNGFSDRFNEKIGVVLSHGMQSDVADYDVVDD